jgi:hypothetical protein
MIKNNFFPLQRDRRIFSIGLSVGQKEDNRVIRSISDVVKNSRVVRLFSREFPFRQGETQSFLSACSK